MGRDETRERIDLADQQEGMDVDAGAAAHVGDGLFAETEREANPGDDPEEVGVVIDETRHLHRLGEGRRYLLLFHTAKIRKYNEKRRASQPASFHSQQNFF